jgi:molecular chaperone GrpE (heat shock protein)
VSAPDLTEESVTSPGGTSVPSPGGTDDAIRAAVHAEFDEVLPYVVEALRRNNAFDEINDRLRAAERRLEARRERPVIVGVHHVLDRIRHLDFDLTVKQALEDDIARLLTEAGYEETGQVGEAYDPARHEAIHGRALDGYALVAKVHTRGLTSYGDMVVRAKVEISPERSSA